MKRLVEDLVVMAVGVPALVWSFVWLYFIATPSSAWFWTAVALTTDVLVPMPVLAAVVDVATVLKSFF